MKAFRRVKVINGREYVYEITPYYDKATKKNRQRSKYLGVLGEDGKVRKVRRQLPRKVFSYGEFLPSLKVIEDLGLRKVLARVFGERKAKLVLALALNRVHRPLAVKHVRSWYEGTILAKEYGNLPLSSQNLSKFLEAVGQSSATFDFCKRLMKRVKTSGTLLYDITSLSSHSSLMTLLEYGYNRDGLNLPQVNLSLVLDKDHGIPVMFDIYPGSIVDVTTFKNTVKKLHSCGAKSFCLVLDRGFFSRANVTEMLDSGLDFVIPAPMRLKDVRSLISKQHAKIEDPKYLRLYQGKPQFVREVSLDIGDKAVEGHLLYDQKREQEEKTAFYRNLRTSIERIEAVELRRWSKPVDIIDRLGGRFASYLNWTVQGDRIAVSVRTKAVSQRVNRMGKMVLLSNGDYEWDEALELYREKDAIEKSFRLLKKDMDVMPMNMQKTDTMKGFVFMNFIGLIVRYRLLRMIKDAGLARKYSIDGMHLELEKLKKVELEDGDMVTCEVTKKQRMILEAMGLCA